MEKELNKRRDLPNTAQHPSPVLRAGHSGGVEDPRPFLESPAQGWQVVVGGAPLGSRNPS